MSAWDTSLGKTIESALSERRARPNRWQRCVEFIRVSREIGFRTFEFPFVRRESQTDRFNLPLSVSSRELSRSDSETKQLVGSAAGRFASREEIRVSWKLNYNAAANWLRGLSLDRPRDNFV